jgi:hypothetical protein
MKSAYAASQKESAGGIMETYFKGYNVLFNLRMNRVYIKDTDSY